MTSFAGMFNWNAARDYLSHNWVNWNGQPTMEHILGSVPTWSTDRPYNTPFPSQALMMHFLYIISSNDMRFHKNRNKIPRNNNGSLFLKSFLKISALWNKMCITLLNLAKSHPPFLLNARDADMKSSKRGTWAHVQYPQRGQGKSPNGAEGINYISGGGVGVGGWGGGSQKMLARKMLTILARKTHISAFAQMQIGIPVIPRVYSKTNVWKILCNTSTHSGTKPLLIVYKG